MSYQVIARKWRPQQFDEVTGQEHITRTLRNAIEHERLHHAYLFCGARGVGKTTTARLLAKALNCHKSGRPIAVTCSAGEPDACPSCLEITESRSIDVLEIDAASTTGVDNVRETIIASLAIAPARDRYKVFIIDEVHMLSPSAFNALLKSIEEPPPRVTFIMATTESQKIPLTIHSRCQQFEFRTIATSKIAERLRLIADAQTVDVSDAALREIARAGEGSMRDAQSAFDQVISFAGEKIELDDVLAALGIAGADLLARVVAGIEQNNPAEALAIVDDLVVRGHDLRNFCRDLLGHLRDLLVAKVAANRPEMLESSATSLVDLQQQAAAFSETDLVRFFHALTATESSLRNATHARFQVEVGLIKLMEMRRLSAIPDVLQRLGQLEAAFRSNAAGDIDPGSSKPTIGAATRPPNTNPAPTRLVGNAPVQKVDQNAQTPPVILRAAGPDESGSASVHKPEPSTGTQSVGNAVALAVAPDDAPFAHQAARYQTGLELIADLKTNLENNRKAILCSALDGARRIELIDDVLILEFPMGEKHLQEILNKPEHVALVRAALREMLGRELAVRVELLAPDANVPLSEAELAAQKTQNLRTQVQDHPLVQQVLSVFGGQLVDVVEDRKASTS